MTTHYDPRGFPPFAVTVDIVLLSVVDDFSVLLVTRGEEPHAGSLALPGGFVRPDESIDEAAVRELGEETGVGSRALRGVHLEQLATFGAVHRDPRMRVVSVAYVALVAGAPTPVAGSDAAGAAWCAVDDVRSGDLAFDHAQILASGIERVRSKLEYTTLATRLAGDRFTLAELRRIYELVWGTPIDPANFRRKVLASDGFVVPTTEKRSAPGGGPPATVYRPGPGVTLNPPLLR